MGKQVSGTGAVRREDLRRVAQQMSNVLYNLAQRDSAITDHDRETFRDLYRQWDTLNHRLRVARKKAA